MRNLLKTARHGSTRLDTARHGSTRLDTRPVEHDLNKGAHGLLQQSHHLPPTFVTSLSLSLSLHHSWIIDNISLAHRNLTFLNLTFFISLFILFYFYRTSKREVVMIAILMMMMRKRKRRTRRKRRSHHVMVILMMIVIVNILVVLVVLVVLVDQVVLVVLVDQVAQIVLFVHQATRIRREDLDRRSQLHRKVEVPDEVVIKIVIEIVIEIVVNHSNGNDHVHLIED
jgi:hypothetical protein